MSDQIVIEDNKEEILPSAASSKIYSKKRSTSKPKKKIMEKKKTHQLQDKIKRIIKENKEKRDHEAEEQTLQSVLSQIPSIQRNLYKKHNVKTTIKLIVQVTPTHKRENSDCM